MKNIARNFDLFSAPAAVWNFNGTLNDSAGVDDLHLSLRAGTLRYVEFLPGMGGVLLDGSTLIGRTVSDAALRFQGDLTFSIMVRMLVPPVGLWLAGMIGSSTSSSSSENHQWAVRGSGSTPRWEYIHEQGSGVAETYSPAEWGYVRGAPKLITIRRTAGVIQGFQEGAPSGPPSAALTAPTGGTAAEFLIGALQGASRIQAVVGPIAVWDVALSDAEIAESYNRTLGGVLGYLTDVS